MKSIVGYIASDNQSQASIATGGLLVIESLLHALHPPELPPPEPEEPFVDPAEIIPPERTK